MVFASFQPGAVGRVAVASFFALERVRIFILNSLPNLAEQSKKTLGETISFVNASGKPPPPSSIPAM